MEDIAVTTVVAWAGLVIGASFGATAQATHFCTMGAISDIVFMGDWNRFRAWMLSIATAVLGAQTLHLGGTVDLTLSIYLGSTLGWAGAVLGGLMFGFGMTMTGGCGNKTLVRLGAGNLKSVLVVLVLGIFAYMTLRGLIGVARIELERLTNVELADAGLAAQGLPDLLALAGVPALAARWIATLAVSGALLWFCFKSAAFRASRRNVVAGLIVGGLVTAGWYATAVIGFDDFDPAAVESVTFVAPVGNAIQYLMTFTGTTINFGVAVVGGVIAGAFVMAKATGTFRIESFTDASDMLRHMAGAALMGTGGVMALGCTIGQGVTGMSTLAVGSVLALVSIVAGGVFGMKYMEEGSLHGAFVTLFARG